MDANIQQIIAPQTDNRTYQYTQLDAGLAEFQTAYAKARAGGQAPAFAWDTNNNLNPVPDADYASGSYQSTTQYFA